MADFAVSAAIRAIDKFSVVADKMGGAWGRFGSKGADAMDRVNEKAGLFKKILGGVVAGNLITGAIGKVAQGIKSMVEAIPEFAERGQLIGRTAEMIGISADSLQRLSYAARLTDTPVEALEISMKKMNMAIGQGARGMGPLVQQMTKLNPQLAMQLRSAKDSRSALLYVADAVSRTNNAQARAAIATAAFGKAGQEMIPMLALGREGLNKLMREASVYGSVLDDKAIAASGRLDDSLKRLHGMVGSIKDQVLSFAVTALSPYIERLVQWLAANKEIIAQRFEGFLERLTTGFRDLWPVVSTLFKGVGWLIRNWPLLGAVYLAWIAAQLALDVALSSNPIGLITLAIEGLIVEVLIIIRYWHEITGALQSAWNWFNKLFANPWIATALYLIASPIWLVVTAVRTLVDLLSGKGWKSFENFIPPWLRGATNKLGLTAAGDTSGMWGGGEKAPNKGMGAFQFINQVNVDNSRAPGVTSTVRASPVITGNPGYQYAGAQ